jgi:hypothetical protein|tara:strand:- start:6090 stop:6371 length:282 start_codon:yes stop_codon:yes gene_type:complete
MALEFLCSTNIEFDEKINIPRDATHYIRKSKTISSRKGRNPRIHFFSVNPISSKRMREIPENAKYVSFKIEWHKFNISYGEPCFYDKNDKVLK